MKKIHAIIIAIILSSSIFLIYNYSDNLFSPNRETVLIKKVLDGDTVELDDSRRIRFLNINAEEKARPHGKEATEFLKKYENKTVELEIAGEDNFNRLLGRLYSDNYINLELVKQGHAHSFIVQDSELKDFKKAEESARRKEIGIWKKSEFYGCLEVEINSKQEFVEIKNNCNTDLKDFTLKDESTKIYKFKKTTTKNFKLYSIKGGDSENELYWGRGKAWNDDKDSIFIRDKKGLLVYYGSYGY